ncbi:DMT superfamily drug/metabolite transporter [Bacillus sp. OxB-1]|uniref:DMT family transporter n=1 Tax=Bacillus sp. (strain OxB-1) TaxID=98228 RepID=UPI000581DAC5|nr:DMT family transporter [Bacillus sp. OxB-1]BAQ10613.1 DMT superfamily drug/metabolite transporter [Bacillus sp. OxB-1]
MRKYIGELALLVTAIIWGSGFVASAVALEHYTPYQILAARFFIGALLLGVVFAKKLKGIRKSTLLKGAALGFFLYVAFALQTVGLQYTTPSKNAFLTAVNVVIVPFLGWLIYKRKIDWYELSGAVLALIGVALLSLQFSAEVNVGDVLTLFCAVGFAFHIFFTARFVKEEDPVLLTLLQMAAASVIGFVVVLFRGETGFSMDPNGTLPLLYLAVFSTTIAFLLQTIAQKFISDTKAAIILATESFWGMVFSVILLSEVLTLKMLLGACFILTAIMLSETKPGFLKKKQIEKST